jgi:hypothetical protein
LPGNIFVGANRTVLYSTGFFPLSKPKKMMDPRIFQHPHDVNFLLSPFDLQGRMAGDVTYHHITIENSLFFHSISFDGYPKGEERWQATR